MNDDSKLAREESIPKARGAPGVSGELLARPNSAISLSRKEGDGYRPPLQRGVYLWLCCEGWMRFGPYEWLRFDDKEGAIIGPNGDFVARKMDGHWRIAHGRGAGMPFSNPTITITREHPHKSSGAHPGVG